MNMLPKLALAVIGIGAASGAAHSATLVVGEGLARSCYEAALTERASQQTLAICDRALSEEALTGPDAVATHVNRGILRMHANDLRGALADYNRAIAMDPTEAEAYLNKAVVLLRAESQWQEARSAFDAAIRYNTRKPELAYFGRAISSEIGGDVAAAYRDYKQASELAPDWAEPARELTRFRVVSSPGS